MEETQKITEINYKDKYIEKLEEQNKILIESIQKKDKIHAIAECVLVGLLCVVMILFSWFYFYAPYTDCQDNSVNGTNNVSVVGNDINNSESDINTLE